MDFVIGLRGGAPSLPLRKARVLAQREISV
jgi:hypothetical protein